MATIFAWTGALRKRGELDGMPRLWWTSPTSWKAATISTIEGGVMTGDLAAMSTLPEIHNGGHGRRSSGPLTRTCARCCNPARF